jgi:uncharacterized protein (DUF433 family)
MKISDIITISQENQSETPVFTGTRVPIQSLFWHLESGVSIDGFLEDFPSVTKLQVIQLLELSNEMVNSPQIIELYETAA